MEENYKSLIQLNIVPKLEPQDEGYVLCGEYVDSIPPVSTVPPLQSEDCGDRLTPRITGDNPFRLKDVRVLVKDCLQDLVTIQADVKNEPEENIYDDSQEACFPHELEENIYDDSQEVCSPANEKDSSSFENDDGESYNPKRHLDNSACRDRNETKKENRRKGKTRNADLHTKKDSSTLESDDDESYNPKRQFDDSIWRDKKEINKEKRRKEKTKNTDLHTKKPNSDSPSSRKRVTENHQSNTESEITLSNLLRPSKKRKEDSQSNLEAELGITLSNILHPSKKRKEVPITYKDTKGSESDLDGDDSPGENYQSYDPKRGLYSKRKRPPVKKGTSLKKIQTTSSGKKTSVKPVPKKPKAVDSVLWSCCEMQFEKFNTFNEHKVQKHFIEELRCSVCIDQSFSSLDEIEKHYLDMHTNSSWSSFHCSECRLVFGVKSSFFEHKAKCIESQAVCSEVLNSLLDVVVAREIESQGVEDYRDNDYRLSCCEKVIDNFEDFIIHKSSDHNIASLTCGLCLNVEETETQLRSHYRRFHFSRFWTRMGLAKHSDDTEEDARPQKNKDSSAADDGSSGFDEVDTKTVQCSALQDGILCQCRTCTKILDEKQPSNTIRSSIVKPFHCALCNLNFKWKSRLNKHLRTHDGIKGYPCDICGKGFTAIRSVQQHKMFMHSSNPLKETCSICGKLLVTKSALKKHIANVHLNMNKNVQFKCNVCEKLLHNKTSYSRHIKTFHKDGEEFTCAHCNRVFRDKRLLIYHMQANHIQNEKFECNECSLTFHTHSKLYAHKRSVHSNLQFSCEICGKVFKKKENAQLHMARHSDETPFICQTCGKGFKRSVNLLQHQYTHSDSRPHVCYICGKTFRLRTHVKQHMAVHGLVRKHKCTVCEQAFASKRELKRHLSTHGILEKS